MRTAFGFDPSINDSAWAIVKEDGSVRCGLIRNSYDGEVGDDWRKCAHMIDQVEMELGPIIAETSKIDIWVCEGQYTTFGKGSQDSSVRLGWISSAVYCMAQRPYGECSQADRVIAIPSKWTRGKPKEYRHPLVRQAVKPEEEWEWVGPKAPGGLMHNVLDAIGLAVWGLQVYKPVDK